MLVAVTGVRLPDPDGSSEPSDEHMNALTATPPVPQTLKPLLSSEGWGMAPCGTPSVHFVVVVLPVLV